MTTSSSSSNTRFANKAEMMRALSGYLPLNSFGLPDGFWRTDMLPLVGDASESDERANDSQVLRDPILATNGHDITDVALNGDAGPILNASTTEEPPQAGTNGAQGHVYHGDVILPEQRQSLRIEIATPLGIEQSILEAAWIPLYYEEGYPQLPSGYSFWDQLDFESMEDHMLFNTYLELGKKGARRIQSLVGAGKSLGYIQEIFNLYYWPMRVKAYDLFNLAARRKQRDAMIFDMEVEHLEEARSLRKRVMEYITDSEDGGFWDDLTPKVAIDFLKLLYQMERVSLGLPMSGPMGGAKDAGQSGTSMEVILRQLVARDGGVSPSGGRGPQAAGASPTKQFADKILSDPNLAAIAQELIIRVTGQSQTP